MVKTFVYSELIPGCTVKDFFEILYGDATAAVAYHKQVDKDESTKVEPWQGNKRAVHFTMPMQLPAVLAKVVGSNTIPVKEEQQVDADESGTLHITSTPIIGVPGGSKFRAVAHLSVFNMPVSGGAGCRVEARVTCTAEGPWGLQSMIESIMIEQSATSVKTYIGFCTARCLAVLSGQATDGAAEISSPRSDATAFEQFFDAPEMLSRMSSFASSTGASHEHGASEMIDTLAVLQVLDAMDGRLTLLAADIAAARKLLIRNNIESPTSLPRPGLGHPGAWMLGFACGAAVVATCFVLKRQGSALISLSSQS